MTISRILTIGDAAQWTDVLRRCTRFDVYHSPEYHRVAELQHEGSARLFVYEDGADVGALPFLLRETGTVPWLSGTKDLDGTSVYGYPGLLTNLVRPNTEFATAFQAALLEHLRREKVVSLFSRLHPLIDNAWLVADIADVVDQGFTVSIGLEPNMGLEELLSRMTGNRRREIQKLRASGIRVVHDTNFVAMGEFRRAYHETMRRAQAAERYFFDEDYFASLREQLDGHLHLFVARSTSDEFLSAALIFVRGDIMQYHLSATPDAFVRLSAVKLVVAEVALWGARHGARWLHLGGGVGGSDSDGVYRFKRGFSDLVHTFRTMRLIVMPDRYDALCERRGDSALPAANFFPHYRAPPT